MALAVNTLNCTTLKQYGKVYACNAVLRHLSPDYLVAVDAKMIIEINHAKYQMNIKYGLIQISYTWHARI